MRVGVNALHLVPGETGGLEIYARRLLPALVAADPALELVVFASREGARVLPGEVVALPFSARSRARRVAAEQTLLPRAARRARVELLHNLFNTAPARPPAPQVTTIHDLVYRRQWHSTPPLMRWAQQLLIPLAARRSRRVITVSQASKADIVELLGVSPGRVDVVPNGPGSDPPAHPLAPAEVRRRLDLPANRPLVLTVAARLPHKNLPRLLEAIALVPGRPLLVSPGYATAHGDELARRAGDSVQFLGWVDDATLDGLYRAADCFVLPSLVEGFGLPLLEAMRRGAPVACSRASALPEVAGDAAVYFDPRDPRSIAAALERLLGDVRLRERLAAAGRERADQFSWAAAAEGTLASYERAVSER